MHEKDWGAPVPLIQMESCSVILCEDHPARIGLECARYFDNKLVTNVIASTFNHYHGAVIEVADALLRSLSSFHHFDFEGFVGQKTGSQGITYLVQIDH